MKRLFQAAIVAVALFAAQSAFADGWVVQRVTAPAKYTQDGDSWNEVRPGMTVPNSSWINTGEGGRVLLRRGTDTMLINAYTLVAAVERGTDNHPKTTLHQKFGEMTVDVKKRGYDQMDVKTPYMAAVVKGTKFSVTGTKLGSTLSVERGLVQVSNAMTGQTGFVGAGGKASIGSTDKSVSMSGTNTSMSTASTSAASNASTGTSNKAGSNGAAKSGNPNAGPGNSNAGGKGKGNSGGNGKGNSGGNGKGNSGSNGNGNSGGMATGTGTAIPAAMAMGTPAAMATGTPAATGTGTTNNPASRRRLSSSLEMALPRQSCFNHKSSCRRGKPPGFNVPWGLAPIP